MADPFLVSVDRPEAPRFNLSLKLRSQLVYFMTPPDSPGLPPIPEKEYWFARNEVTKWLEDGVIELISPLDTDKATEVELSEEQEALLGWLDRNQTQHVRVVE